MPRQPETWGKTLGILLLIMLLATVVLLPANPDVMAADLGWSTPVNISHNQGNSQSPQITVDSEGNLYVVWKDSTTENSGILCSTRPSSGNWSTPQPIPGTSGSSGNPSLAVDHEGRLHVAWQDNITESGIFYANRTSSGDWSVPQKITGSSGNSTAPDIAADGLGNLHVVWQEGLEAPDILYSTKPSDGSWAEQPTNISNNAGWSGSPSIAVDSEGNVHVVWQDDTGGHKDILYATKVSDGGWSASRNISQGERNSSYPRIAVDDEDNPHVVWEETYSQNATDIYPTDIRTQYNTRSGANWLAEPETISPTFPTSNRTFQFRYPSIAVDPAGEPSVVWQDNVLVGSDGYPFWSIAYAIRQNNGEWLSWLNIISQMSLNSHLDSSMAMLAIDAAGNAQVVWQRPVGISNSDIFYATLLPSPPNQPTNTSPEDGATGVSLTPTLEASAFSDPEEADTLYASQWQISTSSGNYTHPVFDKTITSNSTQLSVPSDVLVYNTTYYWQVRYQDRHGSRSPYSNETSFTTTGTTGETTGHSSWLTGRVIGAIVGGVIVVLVVVLWLVFRRRRPVSA